ncbi:MAG: aminodeoxychorismate lyase [Cellvibrio sp.]|uniref:aminodeoxychorismate lyase n=1 Tax=Cellvibrio sp. TaxID=1965322 RepID=UPI0031A457C7
MSINLPLISVNGILDAAISPLDRGFAYGDGVFETCRYQNGSIPLWPYHRERLLQSAARLKIPVDESLLAQYKDALIVQAQAYGVEDAVLKITATRGVGGRGYRLPETVNPTYCLGIFAGNPLQNEQFNAGVSVRICNLRISANPALAGMKHLNRLEHILARSEWASEYAEGLLLDTQGRVVEATVSNLFAVKDNQLYTPDLSSAGVAGVMRRVIVEQFAPAAELTVNVVDMELDFLLSADEIFLCNSVYGIWPVNNVIDDREKNPQQYAFHQHQITQALQHQLLQFF